MMSSPAPSSSPPLTPSSSTSAYIHYSSPTEESIFSRHYRQRYAKPTRDLYLTLDDENDDYLDIFTPESTRSTFFMVSAERGRWKTDPMPQSRISKSEPTSWSPVTLHRSVSEPAPVQEGPPDPEEIAQTSSETVPSLVTDKESSDGREPLSPLPPSSPPLSARDSSPFLSSSPLSSPISVNLSLDDYVPDDTPSAPANAVLGSMENVDSEARPRSKRTDPDKKKRKKEDHPSPEVPKKKRKVEVKTPDGDEEMRGMLIESMALSRASSLPVSSLYKSVMQTRPALKAQKSEQEWICVFRRVLDAGRETGIFGMVESSGKDSKDKPLEPQWFYVPEKDEDEERAALIRSTMLRPGKRSETKKYKQYYYRRWDSEDAA